MDVAETKLSGVKVITPRRFGDQRGFFSETYQKRAFEEAGIVADFVQDNHSYSVDRGVLRGLHFQRPPATQAKLVRVVRGAVLDVVVDLRRGSPTYGQHVQVELSADAGNQIFCPRGFAHAILTLLPHTEIVYKVDAYYAPELDAGIRFDDPDLAIDWPIPAEELLLSEKDRNQPWFRDLPEIFTYS